MKGRKTVSRAWERVCDRARTTRQAVSTRVVAVWLFVHSFTQSVVSGVRGVHRRARTLWQSAVSTIIEKLRNSAQSVGYALLYLCISALIAVYLGYERAAHGVRSGRELARRAAAATVEAIRLGRVKAWRFVLRCHQRAIHLRKATVAVMARLADAAMGVYSSCKDIAGKTRNAMNDSPDYELSKRLDRFAYGLFERLWRDTSNYSRYDKYCKMARFNEGFDVYLSRSLFYSIVAGAVGGALGVIIAFLVAPTLINHDYAIDIPLALARVLDAYAFPLVVLTVTTFIGITIFAVVAGALYYYPIYLAGERGRAIDKTLPHAATFMYALSRGGMNVLDVVREISTAGDTYGEAAEEFAAIRRKVDRTNTDLNSAVREVANTTPSDNLEDFLEDFLAIIDSGSNPENFFLNKSKTYLDRAKEEQRQTLETLEIFSEMYIILFVVSPLFVLILQLTMGLMGGVDTMILNAIPPAVLVGAALFTGIIWLLSSSNSMDDIELDYERQEGVERFDKDEAMEDSRSLSYKWGIRYKTAKNALTKPLSILRQRPPYSVVVTVPLALVFVAYAAYTGIVGTSLAAFEERQIWTTVIYLYIPLVIILLPMSILHELKKRRERKIIRRLHDLFKQAAEANDRGLTLEESIRVATDNSTDALAQELEKAMNRSSWTGDLNGALVRFANKMRVPRLSRTVKLISKANASSGDVQAVLTVAADDLESMYKLDKERKQNALQHIIVIAISFVIGIGVIAMLDSSFLTVVEEQISHSEGGMSGGGAGGGGGGMGMSGDIPVAAFRRVFLHTTMALGLGSGIVAGTMANNDPYSGIKIALVLMTLPLAVFTVF